MVENKPGAGTTLGADQVAKSEPDGYTLLMATSTTLAINKTLYKNLPYDPVKDFAPIGARGRRALCADHQSVDPGEVALPNSLPTPNRSRAWPMARPATAARSISAPKC